MNILCSEFFQIILKVRCKRTRLYYAKYSQVLKHLLCIFNIQNNFPFPVHIDLKIDFNLRISFSSIFKLVFQSAEYKFERCWQSFEIHSHKKKSLTWQNIMENIISSRYRVEIRLVNWMSDWERTFGNSNLDITRKICKISQ